ncbi:putative ATP-dependent DNA helicase YoaA [Sinobacterium norvegicum]|uniref:ATP-dependent DNA helicase YoaA n=1 Tax=Sinobacterium norvegicum TaxID=1641715 RepID=A0ABN8EDG7_9GAMM|nr:ATP-dependent DNA helicase [Sinobacterium norvegicum]CAH0990403.1 putative ATP-dependent DNA helicase YoaA [Sinobacterium norvegicum]
MSTLFAENGLIAQQWPLFVYRQGQQQLAAEISAAFARRNILLAEAPTGTGKTFAYLASVLNSAEPVIISTASHALQYQLVRQDIPQLAKILDKTPEVIELKGIASYLCPKRLEDSLAEGVDKQLAAMLLAMHQYWQRHHSQSLEWRLVADRVGASSSEVSRYSATNHAQCQSMSCPKYARCPYFNQRKKLQSADIAVVNHALFFSSENFLMAPSASTNKLASRFQAVVFDEAHRLDQLSIDRATVCFDSLVVLKLLAQFSAVVRRDAGDSRPSLLAARRCLAIAKSMDEKVNKNREQGAGDWSALLLQSATMARLWRLWQRQITVLLAYSAILSERSPSLALLARRLKRFDMAETIAVDRPVKSERSLWFNRQGAAWSVHSVEVNHLQVLHSLPATQVYLSSALSVNDDFSDFAETLKLPQYHSFKVAETKQENPRALYYHPTALPPPSNPEHIALLLSDVLPLLSANRGRALLLFSSVSNRLKAEQWLKEYTGFHLCIAAQGSAAQAVRRFKSRPLSLLLSAGLWDGLDIKGDDLSLIIIDKIPFSPPDDFRVLARSKVLTKQGIDAFNHWQLPQAILRLRQGVGRLIRSDDDGGVVVIGDSRLHYQGYGEKIMAALPHYPTTMDRQQALSFIESRADHYTPSAASNSDVKLDTR